eukprot:CAMPEP_0114554264 /NCGR_PEP_ID=MMETSP0114-20121206/8118_1 /TAXON_ID=31324 /ORGANISM="Goniomonas sp, Strain m" /LENGTH=326 /DNA_ID=CAMNT_0001739301 /DNA_START=9 /DNA_END=989 /DNA_ORIENTATION=+
MPIDYRKFEQMVDSDSDDEPSKVALTPANSNPPPELFEAMRLSQTGDPEDKKRSHELVAKAIEAGGPEVQERFKHSLAHFEGKQSGAAPAKKEWNKTDIEAVDKGLESTKSKLETQLDTLKKEMERLTAEEDRLKQLQEAGGEEDMMRFLTQQGIKPEDLQRADTDPEFSKKLADNLCESRIKPVGVTQDSETALEIADRVAAAVSGDRDPTVKPRKVAPMRAGEVHKYAAESLPGGKGLMRPEHRLEVDGKEVSVEIIVPELTGMDGVDLDVSEGVLKFEGPVSGDSAVKGYSLRLKLPVKVNADAVTARFVRQKRVLRVKMPIV